MASHGGNLKRKSQLNKKNCSRTRTSIKYAYRVYCSWCGIRDHARPNENTFMHVASGQHFYKCKNGHLGVVGGASYTGEKPFAEENKILESSRL